MIYCYETPDAEDGTPPEEGAPLMVMPNFIPPSWTWVTGTPIGDGWMPPRWYMPGTPTVPVPIIPVTSLPASPWIGFWRWVGRVGVSGILIGMSGHDQPPHQDALDRIKNQTRLLKDIFWDNDFLSTLADGFDFLAQKANAVITANKGPACVQRAWAMMKMAGIMHQRAKELVEEAKGFKAAVDGMSDDDIVANRVDLERVLAYFSERAKKLREIGSELRKEYQALKNGGCCPAGSDSEPAYDESDIESFCDANKSEDDITAEIVAAALAEFDVHDSGPIPTENLVPPSPPETTSGFIGPRGSDPTLGENVIVGEVREWPWFKGWLDYYTQMILDPIGNISWEPRIDTRAAKAPKSAVESDPSVGSVQVRFTGWVDEENGRAAFVVQTVETPGWFNTDTEEEYVLTFGGDSNPQQPQA